MCIRLESRSSHPTMSGLVARSNEESGIRWVRFDVPTPYPSHLTYVASVTRSALFRE